MKSIETTARRGSVRSTIPKYESVQMLQLSEVGELERDGASEQIRGEGPARAPMNHPAKTQQ